MRQAAVLVSANQYIEWVRAWLGMSQREALEFRDQHQTASLNNEQGPEYSDQFAEYRESVRAVLPHLLFLRPDQAQRSLLFKSAGEELRYEELSGGEREVAFLLGQMHRFPLRRGLLLLDEPELHLNAELLRRWLAHVRDNAGEGQVWIATHAMEAAEVAGQDATIVLERAPDGVVREAAPLGDRPVLQTLARALGSPAFSLSSSRYVLIEGAKPTERARFASLSPGLENRFLESGGCEEVVDKLNAVLTFARETDQLRIGAVIDRDHRTPSQIRQLVGELPVHVLAVFEIENFFLYPPALALIAQRAHLGAEAATVALQEASDRFAGLLIAERVATRENLQLSKSIRDVGAAITWSELAEDSSSRIEQLREAFEMAGAQPSDLVANLGSAVDFYATLRSSEELWKKCMGKEIMGVLPAELGISKARYLESQVIRMYEENEITPPDELIALRDYVAAIPYAA
ncbi:MAG: hypothetical protein QOJ38_2012 [Solirubrobacterales bacterium]|nr:hypothetical protein [Solirubrobacterales bacterium]